MHADQTHGINDLRSFFINNKKQIKFLQIIQHQNILINTFDYCFKSNNSKEYPATLKLKLNKINNDLKFNKKISNKKIIFKISKLNMEKLKSTCYIIDKKLAYISDVSDIYQKRF